MCPFARFVLLGSVTIVSACSRDNVGVSILAHEFVGTDSALGVEYHTRVRAESGRGLVRELRLASPAGRAGEGARKAQDPEIDVWGSGGTFQAPIRSTCRIFDDANWACTNVNTTLVNARGDFLVVGTLELRRDTLRETGISGPPIVYYRQLRFFGRSP
jgi:hypothetical protein